MVGAILKVFLVMLVPVALFAVSCLLTGNASKRKCEGCGMSGSGGCGKE